MAPADPRLSMRELLGHLVHEPRQRRVTVLAVVLMSLCVVLADLTGLVALRSTLHQVAASTTAAVAEELATPAARAIAATGGLTPDLRQAGGTVVEAACTDGRVLRLPGEPEQLVLGPGDTRAAGTGATVRTGVGRSGEPYTVAAVPAGTTGCALVVGRPLATTITVLRTEELISLGVVLSSLVATTLAGFVVARTALLPVRRLTAAVEHARATSDFRPVAVSDAYGDLGVLTTSFNGLLRTLAETRERQARLVADAGHELRTPLTSLTTNVDLLRADLHPRVLSVPQQEQLLEDVGEQLAELTSMVGDLVRLARDDSVAAFRPVDLRDPVRSAAERVRRRAGGRVIDLQLDEFHVVGDPDGLERAVTNLLDNAVKWSPPGSTVRVRLHGNRLVVADSGPGIPDADLPYVFDRFFRGASARKTHGTGLGLSIVAKTVEEHGGTVQAGRSPDGGAQLTVQLPGVTHAEAMPGVLVPAS